MNNKNWRELTAYETAEFDLPYLISPAFKRLIEDTEGSGQKALSLQVEPSHYEKNVLTNETADPLGEAKYCVTPYLIHQYENRVLLLTTGKCFSYCRYCFRRGFTSRKQGFINEKELQTVCEYIKKNPQITEILVSGGDPLTGTFEELKNVLTSLRRTSENLLIRLCTRAPIFAPEVFTQKLFDLLKSVQPVWLIPHINHPNELGIEQKKAIRACLESGISVQSQTVLLKGVNDEVSTLVILFHTLTCMGVKPGYLFQLDAAAGTSHFRVPLKEALELWQQLEFKLSGLSRPQFAADLPGGGGKFPLSALVHIEKIKKKFKNGTFSALGIDSVIHKYTL